MYIATDTGQSPFYVLLLPLGILTGSALLVLAHLIRKRGISGDGWAALASALLAGAAFSYTLGMLYIIRLENAYYNCVLERFGVHSPLDTPKFSHARDSLLPMSSLCVWKDGVRIDIVPGFVNVALLVFLAGALACVVLMFAHRRRARGSVTTDQGVGGRSVDDHDGDIERA